MEHNWKEIIGYLAPVFIVLSMMQSNVKKIRLLMIGGCLIFIIYGVLVHAWPVVVANALIGVVTLFYLIRSMNVQQRFSLMDASKASSELVKEFFKLYKNDILSLYPLAEDSVNQKGAVLFFLMKELEPVGVFCYKSFENKTAEILIDYVTEAYRDLRTDRYLYSANEGHLAKEGFQKVIMRTDNSDVKQEMKKIGFQEQEPGSLIKKVG